MCNVGMCTAILTEPCHPCPNGTGSLTGRYGMLLSTDSSKMGQFPLGTWVSLNTQRSHMLPHAPLAQRNTS